MNKKALKKRKKRDRRRKQAGRPSLAMRNASLDKIISKAERHAQAGNIQQAAQTAVEGLETFPDSPEMLAAAGYVYEMAGMIQEANEAHETALRIKPDSSYALQHFARFLIRQGRWKDSLMPLSALTKVEPENHWAYLALGTAHMYLKNLDLAKQLIEKSIAINPTDARAWVNLGNTLRCLRRFKEAEKALKKALGMKRSPDALIALSSLYTDWGDYQKGIMYAEQVLELQNSLSAETLKSAAYPYMKIGDFATAEVLYRKALAMDPSHADSGFGLAVALLVQGRLKEAWPLYRARFKIMQSWLEGPWPIWNGENIRGKKIYICAEQGAGDTINFVRFIPMLKQMGAEEVFFSLQPPLGRLMRCMSEYATLLPFEEINISSLDADFQTALLELPALLGINKPSDIPSKCPYLSIPEELRRKWRAKISQFSNDFRVGLVWAGNPNHADDHNRSIKLSMLAPLSTISGIRLFSLQVGEAAAQIKECSDILDIIDLTHEITDFADTAALIENLDVVVSVDTATAHLAGALGRPVIILLPFSPDWRWFLGREDSPWYPTARLLRQPAPGQWTPVINRLVELLRDWLKEQKRV